MRSMALKMGMKTNIWLILSESWLSISKQSKVLWTRTVLKQWRLVAICCYLKVLRLEAWAAHFALFCWSAEFCKIAIDYWCFVRSALLFGCWTCIRVISSLPGAWTYRILGALLIRRKHGQCLRRGMWDCKQTLQADAATRGVPTKASMEHFAWRNSSLACWTRAASIQVGLFGTMIGMGFMHLVRDHCPEAGESPVTDFATFQFIIVESIVRLLT